MSAKHTPGPWAAFTDDSGSKPHTNIVAFKNRTECVFSLPGHHKKDANVTLIAAAPDLLEALKGLVEAHAIPSTACNERPAYESALAAIAKAEGTA